MVVISLLALSVLTGQDLAPPLSDLDMFPCRDVVVQYTSFWEARRDYLRALDRIIPNAFTRSLADDSQLRVEALWWLSTAQMPTVGEFSRRDCLREYRKAVGENVYYVGGLP
jgi:hypothetical protein